jgi:hypothetical protein
LGVHIREIITDIRLRQNKRTGRITAGSFSERTLITSLVRRRREERRHLALAGRPYLELVRRRLELACRRRCHRRLALEAVVLVLVERRRPCRRSVVGLRSCVLLLFFEVNAYAFYYIINAA